jgi:hypothetical protein
MRTDQGRRRTLALLNIESLVYLSFVGDIQDKRLLVNSQVSATKL